MTSVVDIRHEAYDVYIGRANPRMHLLESKWHNPFKIGPDGTRQQVIEKYREHLLNSPELMAALHELKNKVLGCWCQPLSCHGDILVELVNKLA